MLVPGWASSGGGSSSIASPAALLVDAARLAVVALWRGRVLFWLAEGGAAAALSFDG